MIQTIRMKIIIPMNTLEKNEPKGLIFLDGDALEYTNSPLK